MLLLEHGPCSKAEVKRKKFPNTTRLSLARPRPHQPNVVVCLASPRHADGLGAAAQCALHQRRRRSRQVAAGCLGCGHGKVWVEAHVHEGGDAQRPLVAAWGEEAWGR